MKNNSLLHLLTVSIILLFLFGACASSGDDSSDDKTRDSNLVGTWNAQTLDGTDWTWTEAKLVFTSTTYTYTSYECTEETGTWYTEGGDLFRTVSSSNGVGCEAADAHVYNTYSVDGTVLTFEMPQGEYIWHKEESTDSSDDSDTGSWSASGEGNISAGMPFFTDIHTYDNIPYVAYQDGNDGYLYVKKLSDSTWTDVSGAAVTNVKANYISMAVYDESTIYVAYEDEDNDTLVVDLFNGTGWSTIKTITPTNSIASVAVAMGGDDLYVAYIDGTETSTGSLYVAKYDGTWTDNLGGAAIDTSTYAGYAQGYASSDKTTIDIAVDGSTPYVAYSTSTNASYSFDYEPNVATFDGSNWSVLGSSAIIPSYNARYRPSITINSGVPYVAFGYSYSSTGDYSPTVYKFESGTWTQLGGSYIENVDAKQFNIGFSGTTLFMSYTYDSSGYRYPKVQTWDGSTWSEVGTSSTDFTYGAYQTSFAIDSAGALYLATSQNSSLNIFKYE